MDTQQNFDDLRTAGVDERHAKALIRMLKDALEEKPSTDRLDRMMADFRLEVHRMMGDFRLDVHKELAGFRLQIIWLLVASLLSTAVNLALAFWKQ